MNKKQQKNADDCYYFGGYADFDVQANMLDDTVRMQTYYQAIVNQPALFHQKTVLDVGTGTGVLAIFAARAGAKKVYAVEASPVMAKVAQQLVLDNHLDHIITVLCGTIEEVSIPESVDIIVSEPMGYFLINEQMLQSYLWAKQQYLKPNGLLFPEKAHLYAAPIYGHSLRKTIDNNCRRWLDKEDFFSINYQSVYSLSKRYEMNRARVDQILPEQVLSPASELTIDFYTATPQSLNELCIEIPLQMTRVPMVKEIGLWFDVVFPTIPGAHPVILTTAPNATPTHWYQTLLLLNDPVDCGDHLTVTFKANNMRCYDIKIYSQAKAQVIQHISTTNIKYDYFNHYDTIVLEPSPQFGYE